MILKDVFEKYLYQDLYRRGLHCYVPLRYRFQNTILTNSLTKISLLNNSEC